MLKKEKMYELGSKRSVIRELFEYGKEQAKTVGAENVYDFSIGNPTVEAPSIVNETIRELTMTKSSIELHGYTSAQGDEETRQAIADYLNKTYQTNFLLNIILIFPHQLFLNLDILDIYLKLLFLFLQIILMILYHFSFS